jgi:hypothetical protein
MDPGSISGATTTTTTTKPRDYAAEYARLYGKKATLTEEQKERRQLKSVRSKEARRKKEAEEKK